MYPLPKFFFDISTPTSLTLALSKILTRTLACLAICCICTTNVSSIHILNIGDSFDRQASSDVCNYNNGSLTIWSTEKMAFLDEKYNAFHCNLLLKGSHIDYNITLSNAMIFGSNASGPYWYYDTLKSMKGNIVDTRPRVDYALKLYLQLFSAPDIIYFHTAMWDFSYFNNFDAKHIRDVNILGSSVQKEKLAIARKNYEERMDDIQKVIDAYGLSNNTRLALRSTFYYPTRIGKSSTKCEKGDKDLLIGYNLMQKELAEQHNWTYYDMNADIWGAAGYDYTRCDIIVDNMHLIPLISHVQARKRVGLQHSNYMTLRGHQPLPPDWYSAMFLPNSNIVAKQVLLLMHKSKRYVAGDPSGPLFYITYDDAGQNPVRHRSASEHFQRLFRLGPGDIYYATDEEMAKIPESYEVPAYFNSKNVMYTPFVVRVVNSTEELALTNAEMNLTAIHQYYIIFNWKKHRIHRGDNNKFKISARTSQISAPVANIRKKKKILPSRPQEEQYTDLFTYQQIIKWITDQRIKMLSNVAIISVEKRFIRYMPTGNLIQIMNRMGAL